MKKRTLDLKRYETVGHTADKGILARGATFEELLVNAAEGMFSLVVDGGPLPVTLEETVSAEGPDRESLLVGFLSELLFLFDARRELFSSFEVTGLAAGEDGSLSLTAVARGCRWEEAGAAPAALKAVTWHNLAVREVPGGLEATIIFDV